VLGSVEGIRFIESVPKAEGLIISTQTRAQSRAFWQYVVT